MDFYNEHGQHVTLSRETANDAGHDAVYLVTSDGTLAGRTTRIAPGEWKYIRTNGTTGYARSATLAAEAITA